MGLEAGDKAPNFKLATDENGSVSLAGFKGHPFVLYFYPKDDTPVAPKRRSISAPPLKSLKNWEFPFWACPRTALPPMKIPAKNTN